MTEQGKKQLMNKLELLSENPMHPSLRTKRIQGAEDLSNAVSIWIFILYWYYEGDTMIILVDVGHHDILKQF